MQVATADGGACHFEDDVAGFDDGGLGDGDCRGDWVLALSVFSTGGIVRCDMTGEKDVAARTDLHIVLAHPAQSLHCLA